MPAADASMKGEPRRGTGSARRRGAERLPIGPRCDMSEAGGASVISLSAELDDGTAGGSKIFVRLSAARTVPRLKPRLRTTPTSLVGGPKTSSRTGRRGFSSSDLKRRLRDRGMVGAPCISIGESRDGTFTLLPLNCLRPSDLVVLMLWSRCDRLEASSNGDASVAIA